MLWNFNFEPARLQLLVEIDGKIPRVIPPLPGENIVEAVEKMVGLCGHGYTEGGLSLQPLNMVPCSSPGDSVCKLILGAPNQHPNKVMLLYGYDQASKDSFKDDLINYIFDVKRQDTYRLTLMDDYRFENNPDAIRVYVINKTDGLNIPFNIILVDLPPMGSVDGAQRDLRIMNELEEFLKQNFGGTLVDSINLVASTSTDQLHALDNTYKLLSLCFSELESIAQILVTDSTPYMPLLASLKECNIRYTNFFIFDSGNNADGISPEEHFLTQTFQFFDYHGVDDFFQELSEMSPQKMSLVQYVEEGCVDIRDLARLRILHRYSENVGNIGNLTFKKLIMKSEYHDEATKTEILTLGEATSKPTKTMLLVGNRFSGKTSLLSAIVNHLFGVKYNDNFRLFVNGDPLCRFRKDQNLKKTRFATAYTFNALPSPYDQNNFVVIDTRGLKSTEEQSHNKSVFASISALRQQCRIQHFDIIGFVVPAGTEKFQDSFRSVCRQLNLLMTDGVNEKLILLATQSDAKRPPVFTALRNARFPFLRSYKFNSHTLLTDVQLSDDADPTHQTLSQLYWNIEQCSLSSLCAELLSENPLHKPGSPEGSRTHSAV